MASCKLSKPPPEKLEFDITHEITTRKAWHFPTPFTSKGLTDTNASFDIVIVADGQSLKLPRHRQIALKKDLPSDRTFYETYITEISLTEFVRIANSTTVEIQMNSEATFSLDSQTMAALKHYSVIVSDKEPW